MATAAPATQDTVERVGYREIGGPTGLLADLTPFENYTGSMSAQWVHRRLPDENGEPYGPAGSHVNVYVVYSYSTIIAEYWPVSNTLHINDNHYSTTTARQQTLTRAWTGRMHHHGNCHVVVHEPIGYGSYFLATDFA